MEYIPVMFQICDKLTSQRPRQGLFYCHQLSLGNHRRHYSHAGGRASKLKHPRILGMGKTTPWSTYD